MSRRQRLGQYTSTGWPAISAAARSSRVSVGVWRWNHHTWNPMNASRTARMEARRISFVRVGTNATNLDGSLKVRAARSRTLSGCDAPRFRLAVAAVGTAAFAPTAAPALRLAQISSGLHAAHPGDLEPVRDEAAVRRPAERDGADHPERQEAEDAVHEASARSISYGGEQGLLSMAFHPDYPSVRRVYVNYTNRSGDTRIVEYRVNTQRTRIIPSSARVLLGIDQPYSNHNGGQVLFGLDKKLYVPTGDGGDAGDPGNRAQSMSSRLGKLLRIDVATKQVDDRRARIPQSVAGHARPHDEPVPDRRRRPGQPRGGRHLASDDRPGSRTTAGAATRARSSTTAAPRSTRRATGSIRSTSTRTPRARARSPAGSSTAGGRCRTSAGATSSATTATAASGASRS